MTMDERHWCKPITHDGRTYPATRSASRCSGSPSGRWLEPYDDARPTGMWKAVTLIGRDADWKWIGSTLRVALELGRWRVYVAGTWWTYEPMVAG